MRANLVLAVIVRGGGVVARCVCPPSRCVPNLYVGTVLNVLADPSIRSHARGCRNAKRNREDARRLRSCPALSPPCPVGLRGERSRKPCIAAERANGGPSRARIQIACRECVLGGAFVALSWAMRRRRRMPWVLGGPGSCSPISSPGRRGFETGGHGRVSEEKKGGE